MGAESHSEGNRQVTQRERAIRGSWDSEGKMEGELFTRHSAEADSRTGSWLLLCSCRTRDECKDIVSSVSRDDVYYVEG